MKNEEILAKWKKIEKDMSKSLPAIWIKFGVFKRQVENIPSDAETTAKKVMLYYNTLDSKIYFSNNGEEYVNLYKWWDNYCYAEVSKEYDGVILLSSWNIPIRAKLEDLKLTGTAPFDLKLKVKLNYFNVINKDKTTFGKHYSYNYCTRDYEMSKEVIVGKFNEIRRGSYSYNLISDDTIGLKKAFVNTFGIGLVGGNTYVDFTDAKLILRFLSHKEPMKRETKRQLLIDELLKTELKVPKMTFNKDKAFICVASKVNETYSALRWFMPTATGEPYEVSRLYISKKEHYFCRKNTYGDYIILNNKLNSNSFDASKVIIQDKDAFSGTKLEYFESIYKELKPAERASALYMLTVFPEFEKFYKSGLNKICKNYLKMLYQCSWSSYIENIFGTIQSKEKNITKILGFNKHQLELINSGKHKSHYWYRGIGYYMKDILGVNDCASIDNDTFDTIFNLINGCDDYYIKDALKATCETYSTKVCVNMVPTLKKFIGKYETTQVPGWGGRTYTRNVPVISIYKDYVNMVKMLEGARHMRPHFDTAEDIIRMHDDATAAYNVKKDAVELARFTSRIPIWEKWEYDENEKYAVVIPKKPEDIATEGITLHHCVKSYIQRVAIGDTNIVFIREKDKLDTPFFTVEVGNRGTIEQVHGFGNRNANTEPGLTDFVNEWAKAKKLNATNYNKVR